MKKLILIFRVNLKHLIFIILLINGKELFPQSSSYDSLAINYMEAIKLTDKASPLPDSIKVIIFDYFKSNNINPDDYYTTKDTPPEIVLDEAYVGLVRIGALRDLYRMYLKNEFNDGASGGDGDEIWVIFDNKFKKIKRISNAE